MGKKGGTKRYFNKEYKLSVVKRNINGESSGKVSKELGLDKSLVCHWARAYRDKGEIGLETIIHRYPFYWRGRECFFYLLSGFVQQ